MAQADFAYLPANDAGSALAVSIFANRELVRAELSEDVADAGLVLREAGGLDALQSGEVRPLGEVVLVDCPIVGAAELAALVRLDERAGRADGGREGLRARRLSDRLCQYAGRVQELCGWLERCRARPHAARSPRLFRSRLHG